MYGVRKIDGRCSHREIDNISFGGEDEDMEESFQLLYCAFALALVTRVISYLIMNTWNIGV